MHVYIVGLTGAIHLHTPVPSAHTRSLGKRLPTQSELYHTTMQVAFYTPFTNDIPLPAHPLSMHSVAINVCLLQSGMDPSPPNHPLTHT